MLTFWLIAQAWQANDYQDCASSFPKVQLQATDKIPCVVFELLFHFSLDLCMWWTIDV